MEYMENVLSYENYYKLRESAGCAAEIRGAAYASRRTVKHSANCRKGKRTIL